MKYLEQLREPAYRNSTYAAEGLFRLGLWDYNRTQKPDVAMARYKEVFTWFPDHPRAADALYLFALNAQRQSDNRAAKDAFTLFLERYPHSPLAKHVRDELLPEANRPLEVREKTQ